MADTRGYAEYRYRVLRKEYEQKQEDFRDLWEREIDTDNFETNAFPILLTMAKLKGAMQEVKNIMDYKEG